MNEQQWPTAAQPGWYPEPGGSGGQRYFDGTSWTNHTAPAPPPPKKQGGFNAKWAVGVVAAIAVFAVLASIGDSSDKKTASSSVATPTSARQSAAVDASDSAPAPAMVPLGQEARDGKFSFVVTSVDVTNVGGNPDNQFETVTPKGKFINVHVKVTNVGDRAQTFFASNQNLIVGGKKYEADSTASFWSGGMSDELNPGISEDYVVAFDVPVSTQTMDYIELHDSAFSGGVKAGLG